MYGTFWYSLLVSRTDQYQHSPVGNCGEGRGEGGGIERGGGMLGLATPVCTNLSS